MATRSRTRRRPRGGEQSDWIHTTDDGVYVNGDSDENDTNPGEEAQNAPGAGSPTVDEAARHVRWRSGRPDPLRNLFGDALNSPVKALDELARRTAPQIGLWFLAAFACLTYLHEVNLTPAALLALGWLALQVLHRARRGDFTDGVFWAVVHMVGAAALYIAAGVAWTAVKLYIESSLGRVSFAATDGVAATMDGRADSNALAAEYIATNKPRIVKWIVGWPMSLAHTLATDLHHFISGRVFAWVSNTYVEIIVYATSRTPFTALTRYDALVYASYAVAYFAAGVLWTFAKIYIDVRRQQVSPYIGRMLHQEYHSGQRSYAGVVRALSWTIVKWAITWPVSLVYTVAREPLNMLRDVLVANFGALYRRIIGAAMEAREQQHAD